jgi:hypothetical protein
MIYASGHAGGDQGPIKMTKYIKDDAGGIRAIPS